MDLNLEGKVAIVTGSAQGIGKDISLAFAEEGVNVVVNDINSKLIEEISDQCRKLNGDSFPVVADVSLPSDVNKMVKSVLEKYGRIDILVNNAGILRRGFVDKISEEDWDITIDVNLKGVFNCCRGVIKPMKRQKWGKIINSTSVIAKIPDVGMAAYAVSKAGVTTMTKVLAAELAPYNINVNAYSPGVIETPMTRDIIMNRAEEKLKFISLRRFGKPRDVANLVLFLSSDISSYITGAVVDITGGNLIVQRPWESYKEAGL